MRAFATSETVIDKEGLRRTSDHRSPYQIVVEAPAKLNLFFEVLARRSDGYHEIETLMCPIDLYDTLYFVEDKSGQLELECERVSGLGEPNDTGRSRAETEILPVGQDNLVFKAAELLRRRAGIGLGAKLRLVKRIPLTAGLGGGSSDAAAALIAANKGWGLRLSRNDLIAVAAELGSDVPFFLVGGPAICRGGGECVEPVAGIGPLHFVVARPPAGLSTRAVYSACRPAASPRCTTRLLEILREGNLNQAGRLLFNRLQAAAAQLSPWIERLREAFDREDFLGHSMSGSGTAYFGLCRHASHARCLARRLQANGVGSVFAVHSCR